MDPKRELTMTFSWQVWQVISAGLQELPGRVCIPIMDQMQKQLNEIAAADTTNVTPIKTTDDASAA